MNSIEQSSFVVSLVVLEVLSGLLLPTTRQLQKPSLDIVLAMDNIKDLIDTLRQMRSADKFKELFAEASLVANMLDIELAKPRLASRSVYRAAAGGTDQSVEQYFRINVFYPAIDSIVTDLELCFGERQRRVVELARLIPAFMLKNCENNWSVVESSISVYGHLLEEPMVVVRCECSLWQRKWSNFSKEDCPKSALATLDSCASFPNISALLQILATLPGTTAEAERMFSKMEKILTAIRSTMEEQRLEALLLLQISPSIDDVIKRFATTSTRRINFIL